MRRAVLSVFLFGLVAFGLVACAGRSSEPVGLRTSDGSRSVEASRPLLPDQVGFVNDFAGVLTESEEASLENALQEFKSAAAIDLVVATVATTGDKSAFEFSKDAGNRWNVGATNPDKAGVFLLVAVEDRRWHIQVTRGLERAVSNDDVTRLGAVMQPHFKNGLFAEGIKQCVDGIIRELKAARRSAT